MSLTQILSVCHFKIVINLQTYAILSKLDLFALFFLFLRKEKKSNFPGTRKERISLEKKIKILLKMFVKLFSLYFCSIFFNKSCYFSSHFFCIDTI